MAHSAQASLHSFAKLKSIAVVQVSSRWNFKTAAAIALFSSLSLTGCISSKTDAASTEAQRPSVIATTTIIADLTATVAGDEIALTSILSPGDDPQTYEPSPNEMEAIEQADLVLYNGFNLEPALIKQIKNLEQKVPTLPVAEVADVPNINPAGQTPIDPHIWGDVRNGIAMVNSIRDALIELAPEDQALFISNAQTLNAQLVDLDTWIFRQVETIPPNNRQLVTPQDAFQYYSTAYELEASSHNQTQATGDAPVLTELYAHSIGQPGSPGDSYFKMMESNTKAIVEALGGSYQPFPGISATSAATEPATDP